MKLSSIRRSFTRVEDHPAESDLLLKGIIEALTEYAIFMIDANGRILTWNTGAERLKGYQAEEVVGKHIRMFYLPEDQKAGRPEKSLAQAKSEGKAEDEWWRVKKDGSKIWATVSITVVKDSSGRTAGYLKVIRDITERKTYEQSLQAALHSREEVLAFVSHDLRNPLGVVMMSANLLDRKSQDAQVKQQTKKIMTAGKRMNRLIEDLLDLSRLDSGHFTLNQATRCGKELVDEVVDLMRPYAEEKSIQLEVDYGTGDFTLRCDHDHLVRVFANLLGNAIKFTPEDGIVGLSIRVLDGDVLFSVSDTGPGIAEHHIPHVFDRYWQAKKTAHKGAGLGLSIAKGIVEAHGGKIWVESQFGEGCRFYFTIPRESSGLS